MSWVERTHMYFGQGKKPKSKKENKPKEVEGTGKRGKRTQEPQDD